MIQARATIAPFPDVCTSRFAPHPFALLSPCPTRLDRARQDATRFANSLAAPKGRNARFWIAAFADAEGSRSSNERLSAQRAANIAAAVRAAGAKFGNDRVQAFSYLAPIACNDSDMGRMHNRRVEIWLSK